MHAVMLLQLHLIHMMMRWFSFSFWQRQRKFARNKLYLLCVFSPFCLFPTATWIIKSLFFFFEKPLQSILYLSLLQLLHLFFLMTQVQHWCSAPPPSAAARRKIICFAIFQTAFVKSCSNAPESVWPFLFIRRCELEKERAKAGQKRGGGI